METRPIGSKYWQCSKCGKRFATREAAQAHVCTKAGEAAIVEVEGTYDESMDMPIPKTKK